MVYVSTSLGSCFWSQTQCPECPLRTFLSWVQSTWLLVVTEEWRRGLTFTEWIGGLICQNVWMSFHWPCFEMKKLRLGCSSDVSFVRGTEMQSAASRLSIWLTHRLSCGPGSWDLLCEGLGHPECLPGACLWSPGPQTHPFASLEGLWALWNETTAESLVVYIWNVGVVFFFFLLWKKFKVEYWGCLD